MTVLRRPNNSRELINAEEESGLRPEVARLLEMVDLNDMSWPKTAAVLSEMTSAGVDLDETALSIALKLGRFRWIRDGEVVALNAAANARRRTVPSRSPQESIVYYVRRGALIKIGTTADPIGRFTDLLPEAILAFEPGGQHQEAQRHRQFSHLRHGDIRSEYFTPAAELMEHIKNIHDQHGDPDPSWPTTANMPERAHLIGRKALRELPTPTTMEYTTASEGADRLGISRSTVSGWIYRGRLPRVGVNEEGRPVYYIEHMLYLRSLVAGRRTKPDRKKSGAK